MKGTKFVSIIMLAFFSIIVFPATWISCKQGAPSESVLVNKTVTIAGGGGGAELSFNASTGQKISITLKAANTSMEPYGYLEYPGGSADYYPSLDTVKNAANTIEIRLNRTGQYNFTIFDGSNQGGDVLVKITILPANTTQ